MYLMICLVKTKDHYSGVKESGAANDGGSRKSMKGGEEGRVK